MNLIPTIGIEMHCEMKSVSKVFSSAANTYSKHSNNHVSAIDLALPGILPSLNKECVRKAILMSSILNCEIPEYLYFDRKNYYYPDLPKGYQITQSHAPIGINGLIDIPYEDGTLPIKIHDIHLEEDTARLEHLTNETLINYNRAGVPLLELVTEPVFHDKKEVLAFLEYIRRIYQYTDISDADIKKGQIRCDVNISLSKDETKLGTKVEIKNVNSFSNIEKVIDIEIARQKELYEAGRELEIEQETRRFDEAFNTTVRMRSKADALDYKYFVEPNIPKIFIDPEWISDIKRTIPELPLARIKRYQESGLSKEDISTIVKERNISDFYDECLKNGADAKIACNWITGSILAYLNRMEKGITDISLTPKDLTLLISKITDKTLSNKQAKEIIEQVLGESKSLEECLNTTDSQISDNVYLNDLVTKIMKENPSQVESYKSGRTNLFNFFVGAVMKETKGKANPVLTKEIIEKKLTE